MSSDTTTVMTVGGSAPISNKSIVREKLNAQIHLLYTRKVRENVLHFHTCLVMVWFAHDLGV